jgi:hypothetical protein
MTFTVEFVLLRPDSGTASVRPTCSISGIACRRSSSASTRGVAAAKLRTSHSLDDSPGRFGVAGSDMLAVRTRSTSTVGSTFARRRSFRSGARRPQATQRHRDLEHDHAARAGARCRRAGARFVAARLPGFGAQ